MALITSVPEGSKVVDLDASRIARAEARTEKTYIKLSVGFIEVNPEIALAASEDFEAGRIREGIASLLIDASDVDVLYEAGFTAEDLATVIEYVSGKTLGESQASQKP